MIASYTYADDQPISMTRGGETYYQTNYRGDVVALTDSAGAVVATYEYDAYGNLLKETGNVENPYRYAGYRYDEETGLYYLQSRYYNPETGRFLTRDKLEGFENEPLTLNKYAYGNNNPVVMVDPDGNAAWALGAVYFIPGVGQVALGVTAAIAIGIAIGATIHYAKKRAKGKSRTAVRQKGNPPLKRGRTISSKKAIERLRKGKDVISSSKKRAKKLMKKASYGGKKVIHDPPHDPKYRPHFHHKSRKKGFGHSFY